MTERFPVMMVHNRYRYPGGEDRSFEADMALLREQGHPVIPFEISNARIRGMGSIRLLFRTVWSIESSRQIAAFIRRHRPAVLHLHNTFPLVSPSVYYTAARHGVPVVQRLSNYRLLCPNALFLRNGRVCEDCLGRHVAWPALRYGCYRDSRMTTAAVVFMLAFHRGLRTWNRRVHRFITLSDFAKQKFTEGGLAPARIAVRPNFLRTDPGMGAGSRQGAVFVGMLQPWKGVDVLVRAWQQLPRDVVLRIVGDGPEMPALRRMAGGDRRIRFLGEQDAGGVFDALRRARFMVFPSIVYEVFPRTVIEAFACGAPVIAPGQGAAGTIVRDGITGLHCRPADVADCTAKIAWALDHPEAIERMRHAARAEFENRYTAPAAYASLIKIYREAMAMQPADRPKPVAGLSRGQPNGGGQPSESEDAHRSVVTPKSVRERDRFPVLMIHNRYRHPGGEDLAFEADVALLREQGHPVIVHETSNDRIAGMRSIHLLFGTLWSRETYRRVETLIRRHRPAVVHCHNFFPLLSPSLIYAAARHGVPVVQHLHNYRLVCPNALFLRKGRVCEECLGRRIAWPAIRYGCYRDSRAVTAAVVAMILAHRGLRSWEQRVAALITVSEFARRKFIEGGLEPARIEVRPNYLLEDPGIGTGSREGGVFVGMLQPWKGIDILIQAWRNLTEPAELRVIGDGPESESLQAMAAGDRRIRFLGPLETPRVFDGLRSARFLVFPSIVYETFGRPLIEAFACGTPVIAAKLGPASELVEAGRTGLHFEPGNIDDLTCKIVWALNHPSEMLGMGRAARREYEQRYTADAAYSSLIRIYHKAIERNPSRACRDHRGARFPVR